MTTEDPHDQTATAADEQPAGGQAPARAELLGTTALTMRVRCPCGKRLDVNREDWQWNGVTICPRCGRGILDHSLLVIGRREALSMLEERKPTEKELRALRHMEMSLRHFILRYGEYPRHYWSPPTNRMADEVGRLLAELDESRSDRGAPPVVATGGAFLDDLVEGAHESDHEEDDEPGGDPLQGEAAQPLTAWDVVRARGREAAEGLEAELAAAREAEAAGDDEDEGELLDEGEE